MKFSFLELLDYLQLLGTRRQAIGRARLGYEGKGQYPVLVVEPDPLVSEATTGLLIYDVALLVLDREADEAGTYRKDPEQWPAVLAHTGQWADEVVEMLRHEYPGDLVKGSYSRVALTEYGGDLAIGWRIELKLQVTQQLNRVTNAALFAPTPPPTPPKPTGFVEVAWVHIAKATVAGTAITRTVGGYDDTAGAQGATMSGASSAATPAAFRCLASAANVGEEAFAGLSADRTTAPGPRPDADGHGIQAGWRLNGLEAQPYGAVFQFNYPPAQLCADGAELRVNVLTDGTCVFLVDGQETHRTGAGAVVPVGLYATCLLYTFHAVVAGAQVAFAASVPTGL